MPAPDDPLHEPVVVALQDVDVLAPDETPAGVRLARLITKGATGADLMLGACWMAPGEATSFDLSEPGPGPLPAQEAYYVISGRVRVSFGDRRVEAGPQAAVWFPPGREYRVEAIGDDEVFLVYTVVPAAR
jgi:mannose-6-phosphate isomerase-like protein (cupin superfamily)